MVEGIPGVPRARGYFATPGVPSPRGGTRVDGGGGVRAREDVRSAGTDIRRYYSDETSRELLRILCRVCICTVPPCVVVEQPRESAPVRGCIGSSACLCVVRFPRG